VPRYDIPKAAPEPLRRVQLFVNSVDLSHGREWIGEWLEREGVVPTRTAVARAQEVREALRELLYENNRQPGGADPHPVLEAAAEAARLSVDFRRGELVARARGVDGAIGRVLAVAYAAMRDGSFARLKACRNHDCRWAFYDYSKNRSASWCSMQLCGNRTKTRAYRRRHAGRS
jgi:predicted RNA-binding Zn ribbon-like protein